MGKDKKEKKDKDSKDKDKKDKDSKKMDKKAKKEAKKRAKQEKKKQTKKSCAQVASFANVSKIAPAVSEKCQSANQASGGVAAQWGSSGQQPGVLIWRIEKFHVNPWPSDMYGQFHTGDSYIVLHTYKQGPKLAHDIFFWLGSETTQDEAGTAAYKTVELDDYLGGGPVQHREVQGFESPAFCQLFSSHGGVMYLDGGIETGFKHVVGGPGGRAPIKRLLHVKGKRGAVRMTQVPLEASSLNSGDAFLLDLGDKIMIWLGKQSSQTEKQQAWACANGLKQDRGSKPEVTDFREGDGDQSQFFEHLEGDADDVLDADEAGDDDDVDTQKRILKLSDASGSLQFTVVSEGKLAKSFLSSDDAFIIDSGFEVFVWIGNGASAAERKNALGYAQRYVEDQGRSYLPITKCFEKTASSAFDALF